jgi:hypothetical protein
LGDGVEADLDPYGDPLLGIGLFQEAIGAPLSIEYAVEADNGLGLIRCRAFCASIVAVREMPGLDDTCVNYALIGYNGQQGE